MEPNRVGEVQATRKKSNLKNMSIYCTVHPVLLKQVKFTKSWKAHFIIVSSLTSERRIFLHLVT
jgi:hypothetical protein